MTTKKALEIMMQLKAEYFYAFKDMPDELFKIKVENFVKGLKGYTDEEIDTALRIVLKENKTLPTTAHFVEIIERNRELKLPTAEEEWDNVTKVLSKLKWNSNNLSPYLTDDEWKKHKEKQNAIYQTLSEDVKAFYVSYSSFLGLLDLQRLDTERTRFLKNFADFRKKLKQKADLEDIFV